MTKKQLSLVQLLNRLTDYEKACLFTALKNYHNIIKNEDFNRDDLTDIKSVMICSFDLIKKEG